MRRIGLGAFAIALTLGAASVASAQQAQGQREQRQEQHQGRWQREGRRHGERALLKGIKLTDQQKAQLKQIREKYAAQAKELRQSLRPASTQGQAQGQREQRREDRQAFRNSPEFQRFRALREQELKDVRAVLTPDQQRTFDKNAQEQKARMEKWQQKRQERQEQRRGG